MRTSAPRIALGTPIALAASIGILLAAPSVEALCAALGRAAPTRFLASPASVPRGAAMVLDLGSAEGAPTARLTYGGTTTSRTLALDPIAPSLTRVRVPTDAPTGRATLEGILGAPVAIDVTAEPIPPAPRAPHVATLRRWSPPVPGDPEASAFEALVEDVPPADVVALVASWGTDQTWAEPHRRTTRFLLGFIGRCSTRGHLASVGDRAVLFYVDRFGQLSPPTPPIEVRAE